MKEQQSDNHASAESIEIESGNIRIVGKLILANALSLHQSGSITLHYELPFRLVVDTEEGTRLEAQYTPEMGWSVAESIPMPDTSNVSGTKQ